MSEFDTQVEAKGIPRQKYVILQNRRVGLNRSLYSRFFLLVLLRLKREPSRDRDGRRREEGDRQVLAQGEARRLDDG